MTVHPQSDGDAIWSPDGERFAFSSNRASDGHINIYVASCKGTGDDRVLLTSDADVIPTSWSRDGKNILFSRFGSSPSIWVLNLEGDPKDTPLLKSAAFDQWIGVFSPNAHFLAYTPNESGRSEVFVKTFPPTSDKWSISTGGGDWPVWRDDGQELFYVSPDAKLMAVDLKTAQKFESGTPKQLFQISYRPGPDFPYAVSKDGTRFLINTPEANTSSPMVVVLHWTGMLKQKR